MGRTSPQPRTQSPDTHEQNKAGGADRRLPLSLFRDINAGKKLPAFAGSHANKAAQILQSFTGGPEHLAQGSAAALLALEGHNAHHGSTAIRPAAIPFKKVEHFVIKRPVLFCGFPFSLPEKREKSQNWAFQFVVTLSLRHIPLSWVWPPVTRRRIPGYSVPRRPTCHPVPTSP